MPRWVIPAIVVFWTGYLLTFTARFVFHRLSALLVMLLVSVFLSLAIEPGVNRLAGRGWPRGRSTLMILLGVLGAFLIFAGAVGTLVGTQVADLLSESDAYITDTVNFVNDTFGTNVDPQDVIDEFNDPDGRVQQFVTSQSDEAVRLSLAAVGVIFQALSVLLFTYYLVADGPRMRRALCSRLTPARQERVLQGWELAITKTGGYLYSRALLALLSAFFHWVVFQSIGTPAPVALALWVGLVSQFLPVVGTYLAGILPVLLTLLDSPLKALIVVIFIVVYQQIENYVFSPRITARTMELHPAVAFGAALGGASLLGFVGALLALPAAAMLQALASEWGNRYDVMDNHLTAVTDPRGEIAQRPERSTGSAGGGSDVTRFDGRLDPIAIATRSDLEESVHHGAGAAIDADGALMASVGDADLVVYPRSCLKPMQAQAMVDLGLELPEDLLAVACASHDGSPMHLDAVSRILGRYGLTAADLANTAARPYGAAARAAARMAGIEPSPLQQNCSGKHAAMLATCVINGWSTTSYLELEHPLQVAITASFEARGASVHHVGVDGCGAPTHALSLRDLAAAFSMLASSGSAVGRAMSANPAMVGGPDRDVTLWMQALPTLMAKEGAAGVMAVGLTDGRAAAFKIADGSDSARQAVTPQALRAVGVDIDSLAPDTVARVRTPLFGHGHEVGELRALDWTPCSS